MGGVLLFIVLALPGGLASIPERVRALVARGRPTREDRIEEISVSPLNVNDSPRPSGGRPREGGESNGHLLVVRGLSKHFIALRAVAGVDLDLTTRKVPAVSGPTAAGKPSSFNLVWCG